MWPPACGAPGTAGRWLRAVVLAVAGPGVAGCTVVPGSGVPPQVNAPAVQPGAPPAASTAPRAAPAAPSAAPAALTAPGAGEIVAAGRRSYTSYCARCHGLNLVGSGIGFDLRQFPAHDKARFLRSVNQGLRNMPAWQGLLSADQVESIWAYVGSVNGWAAKAP
jgi:mono/diheme cytochrome c family protein